MLRLATLLWAAAVVVQLARSDDEESLQEAVLATKLAIGDVNIKLAELKPEIYLIEEDVMEDEGQLEEEKQLKKQRLQLILKLKKQLIESMATMGQFNPNP